MGDGFDFLDQFCSSTSGDFGALAIMDGSLDALSDMEEGSTSQGHVPGLDRDSCNRSKLSDWSVPLLQIAQDLRERAAQVRYETMRTVLGGHDVSLRAVSLGMNFCVEPSSVLEPLVPSLTAFKGYILRVIVRAKMSMVMFYSRIRGLSVRSRVSWGEMEGVN